jgi:hypothetical protein
MIREKMASDSSINRHDFIPEPLLLNVEQTAALLNVGSSLIYAMDKTGELGPEGVRLRARRFWTREELTAWVRAGCPRREKWSALKNAQNLLE